METTRVDDIPVLIASPYGRAPGRRWAVWMHFLGGTKELMAPFCCSGGVIACRLTHGSTGTEPRNLPIN
jgi:hypothetical protein